MGKVGDKMGLLLAEADLHMRAQRYVQGWKKREKQKRQEARKKEREDQRERERIRKDEEKKKRMEQEEKERIKKEKEKKEEERKLLKEIFEIPPLNRITPLGFRLINVDKKVEATSADYDLLGLSILAFFLESAEPKSVRCLDLIEIISDTGKCYLASGEMEIRKKCKNLSNIYFLPDSLNAVKDVLAKIIPKCADVLITLESSESITTFKEKEDEYSLGNVSDLAEYWINEAEISELNNRTLEKCLTICDKWKNNNYAVQFGRKAYDFWKEKMAELGKTF